MQPAEHNLTCIIVLTRVIIGDLLLILFKLLNFFSFLLGLLVKYLLEGLKILFNLNLLLIILELVKQYLRHNPQIALHYWLGFLYKVCHSGVRFFFHCCLGRSQDSILLRKVDAM